MSSPPAVVESQPGCRRQQQICLPGLKSNQLITCPGQIHNMYMPFISYLCIHPVAYRSSLRLRSQSTKQSAPIRHSPEPLVLHIPMHFSASTPPPERLLVQDHDMSPTTIYHCHGICASWHPWPWQSHVLIARDYILLYRCAFSLSNAIPCCLGHLRISVVSGV